MSEGPIRDEEAIRELDHAADALAEVEAAVRAVGEDELEAVAEAREDVRRLLSRYEERATGSGDFEAYVEFQGKVVELVEGFSEDLRGRDAAERLLEIFDRRRLSAADFERAREALSPLDDDAALLSDRNAALERYRSARRAVLDARADLDARIAELDRICSFADAPLDAPVGDLREPIAAYNDAVRDAFCAFLADESARTVLGFVDRTAAYPLVEFEPPPDDLRSFVDHHPAGTEPLPDLLAFAGFTRSKLGHYVDDPDAFQRVVGPNRPYLERLSADPLLVEWPPPDAAALRFRARELVPVVDWFAPADVVAALHGVRDLANDPARYERLRESARARDALTDDERERLRSGAVASEREALETRRERVESALDRHPER